MNFAPKNVIPPKILTINIDSSKILTPKDLNPKYFKTQKYLALQEVLPPNNYDPSKMLTHQKCRSPKFVKALKVTKPVFFFTLTTMTPRNCNTKICQLNSKLFFSSIDKMQPNVNTTNLTLQFLWISLLLFFFWKRDWHFWFVDWFLEQKKYCKCTLSWVSSVHLETGFPSCEWLGLKGVPSDMLLSGSQEWRSRYK